MIRDGLVGRFAESIAGHDAGTVYVILAEDSAYMYLSDGRFRKISKPKKKNKKHIRLMNETVQEELLNRLSRKKKVFDHEIKYAIKTVSRKEEGHV